jgi:outer membrane protein assembly factor BamB
VQREKTGKNVRISWSTPFVWENAMRTEIVFTCGNSICSYDLDGKLLWELGGLSTNTTPTPFAAQGLLFVTSGYPGDIFRPAYAIRPGASGDISLKEEETSNQFVAWSQRQLGTYMPSALVYGDYIYNLYSQGFIQCNEAKTGTSVYSRRRIDLGASGFTASPWAYNGKIFALSEDGDTYVIQPGPEFKLLGKNSLGEMALATPAVVRGNLIMRSVSSLYRIGTTSGGKKAAAK